MLVLIPAIITIDTFFLQAIFDNESPENTSDNKSPENTFGLRFLIFVFPILAITLSLIGESNLKRRWERTLESIAHLNKLEDLLGLRGDLPKNRTVFLKDKPERYFREIKEEGVAIDTEDDFIEQKRLKNNMYRPMRRVYAVFKYRSSLNVRSTVFGCMDYSWPVESIAINQCQNIKDKRNASKQSS